MGELAQWRRLLGSQKWQRPGGGAGGGGAGSPFAGARSIAAGGGGAGVGRETERNVLVEASGECGQEDLANEAVHWASGPLSAVDSAGPCESRRKKRRAVDTPPPGW
jgi:hypothetical protein